MDTETRVAHLRHAAEERYARLEEGRRSAYFVALGKRYADIDGSTYGGLLAIELFTTVLPLVILGFGYFSGFARNASVGNAVIRELGLHHPLDDYFRNAFGSSDALRSSWTVIGMAGFLVWGVPMAITVAGMFASAWQREPFTIWQRLWRGAAWFLVYLATMVLHERIAYAHARVGAVRVLLFVVSLIPMWLFWSATPALLVRDGARGARFLVKAGLVGTVIDGVILSIAFRIAFPHLLNGWRSFGPIGVAMAIMTWCGVLGIGWVVIACSSAVLWERSAPLATVLNAEDDAVPESQPTS